MVPRAASATATMTAWESPMARVLVYGGLLAVQVVAWAESMSVGAFVSGLTTIIGGLLMCSILAYRQINAVRREEAQKWEEFHAKSLSAQLEAIKADTESLRRSNHEIRGELSAAKLHNAELQDDLSRVTGQLLEVTERYHATNEALAKSHQQIYSHRDEVEKLRRALGVAHTQNVKRADETLAVAKEIRQVVGEVKATQSAGGTSAEIPFLHEATPRPEPPPPRRPRGGGPEEAI